MRLLLFLALWFAFSCATWALLATFIGKHQRREP